VGRDTQSAQVTPFRKQAPDKLIGLMCQPSLKRPASRVGAMPVAVAIRMLPACALAHSVNEPGRLYLFAFQNLPIFGVPAGGVSPPVSTGARSASPNNLNPPSWPEQFQRHAPSLAWQDNEQTPSKPRQCRHSVKKWRICPYPSCSISSLNTSQVIPFTSLLPRNLGGVSSSRNRN
jgi:hypothetical protein